jgi:putative spermidine/putrescine transport system permease protein
MFSARPRLPAGAIHVLPLFLAMLLAFNLPIFLMLGRSVSVLDFSLQHYERLIEAPVYLRVLANTFKIAVISTLACMVLGYPLAYWMRSLSPGCQLIAVSLVVLPFWVSILVRTYAWIVVLGNDGVVNRTLMAMGWITAPLPFLYAELGVVIGTTNILLPFLVLPLFAAMVKI